MDAYTPFKFIIFKYSETIVYACKNAQKCYASYTYVLAWLRNFPWSDLYNQRLMGEQICERLQVLRLSNCLHNLTLYWITQ